jgi:tRNA-splicing ligase RtcB
MSNGELAPLCAWTIHRWPTEVAAAVDRLRAADDVAHVAIMPDVHLSADVCIGAVVATHSLLYPQAVGGDIGCGMAALALNLEADALDGERPAARLLAGLYEDVPSNRLRRAQELPVALAPNQLSDPRLGKLATRDGAVQLGTLGRGNHFLEFQADSAGRLWALVHSGSRAMGQAITAHHLSRATPTPRKLAALEASSEAGQAYLADLAWARAYAEESRLAMLRGVERLVDRLFAASADWDSLIHSDQNHVRHETHAGRQLWVHRKGAQPASDSEPGIVPGSMGAPSFHTVGRGCAAALESCSHGAGRRLSRTEARRAVSEREFARQVGRLWYDRRRKEALRDEAPAAYNGIRAVMHAQQELTKIVRELRPLLSYKGT